MFKIFYRLIYPIIILVAFSAHAETTFKCKGKHIEGFSKFDVQRYCGKPLFKDSYLKNGKILSGNDIRNIRWNEVQQWFYVTGPQKTSYAVEFENGQVVRVIKGESSP